MLPQVITLNFHNNVEQSIQYSIHLILNVTTYILHNSSAIKIIIDDMMFISFQL
jgi:hypothetical protein